MALGYIIVDDKDAVVLAHARCHNCHAILKLVATATRPGGRWRHLHSNNLWCVHSVDGKIDIRSADPYNTVWTHADQLLAEAIWTTL